MRLAALLKPAQEEHMISHKCSFGQLWVVA